MKDPLFLDTSCFIYLIENHPQFALPLRSVFSDLGKKKIQAVTSVVTVAEVLVKPMELKRDDLIQKYHELFTQVSSLHVVAPTYETAREAADICAVHRFILIDSFQLALAKERNCKTFLTNDDRLKSYRDLPVKLISSL